MHLTVLDVESTLCILSIDRKHEVSKLNVGVVLIFAIREISNRENEFDVNSRNIRPSKITLYTVESLQHNQTFPLKTFLPNFRRYISNSLLNKYN